MSVLQHDDTGGKDVWVGLVSRVISPFIYYEPLGGKGCEGGPVFRDYEPVALHRSVDVRACVHVLHVLFGCVDVVHRPRKCIK